MARNLFNRLPLVITCGLAAFAPALPAQQASVAAEAKQAYTGIKNNLMKMADKMPEDQYGFKPTPDIRSFGQLVGHVADSAGRTCSSTSGEAKSLGAASKTSKAELTAALKEAFTLCDAAYESLSDSNMSEAIKTPRGQRTRLGALVGNTVHLNEEYGYMAVYLRLKGVVPPSSEGR